LRIFDYPHGGIASMMTWTAPDLTELDIQLTAKAPGQVERVASWGTGEWLSSTYAQDTPTPPGTDTFS
jgi:hypothetical protein